MKARVSSLILLAILIVSRPVFGYADDESVRERDLATSPKNGWGDFPVVEEPRPLEWWETALLWVPNRIVDLVDVFRVDAGLGPAYGGVIRITRYAQVGYRKFNPLSVRVGDFGRQAPVLVERSNELGVGPSFLTSKDRKVCTGELGIGLDVLIAGAYAGICTEELFDFVSGVFFFDPLDDDIK